VNDGTLDNDTFLRAPQTRCRRPGTRKAHRTDNSGPASRWSRVVQLPAHALVHLYSTSTVCQRPKGGADCQVSQCSFLPSRRRGHLSSPANAPQPHAAATVVPAEPSEVRTAAAASRAPPALLRMWIVPRPPLLAFISRAAPARGPPHPILPFSPSPTPPPPPPPRPGPVPVPVLFPARTVLHIDLAEAARGGQGEILV